MIAKGTPVSLAMDKALLLLQSMVRNQAFTMTYADCFFGMGIVLIASIVLLAVMPKPAAGAAPAGH